MIQRYILKLVQEVLKDTPVVLIQGPSKVGKTTLLKQINQSEESFEYISFADEKTRTYAQSNPVGFLRDKPRVILDEIQYVPELFPEIGRQADIDATPGKFLIAASADVYLLSNPEINLTGKIESIDLLPVAQFELQDREPTFLKKLFSGSFTESPQHLIVGSKLHDIIAKGGFPESLATKDKDSRIAWMSSYLNEEIVRNLDEISEIDNLIAIPHFIRGLAENTGQIINSSRLGRQIGMSYKTGQRYLDLIEQLFITVPIYPWSSHQLKSVVKAPKLQFLDTGFLASILNLDFKETIPDMEKLEQLAKNFVFSELNCLICSTGNQFSLYFYRGFNEKEVDFVVDKGNQIAGVSVTAKAKVENKDLNNLRSFKSDAKDLFAFGVLLYDGERVIPFEDDLFAVPISSLWD